MQNLLIGHLGLSLEYQRPKAPTAALFARPRHPYTAALIRAVPIPDPRAPSGDVALAGEVANPAHPPSGCYFHPRCPFVVERCRAEAPALRQVDGHAALSPRGGAEPGGRLAGHRVMTVLTLSS